MEIKVPAEFDGRLRILNNGELVAFKEPEWDYWLVKETHCNNCGECCMGFPPSPYGCNEEGNCNWLVRMNDGTWNCKKFIDRPMRCVDDPTDREAVGCSITYRKVSCG